MLSLNTRPFLCDLPPSVLAGCFQANDKKTVDRILGVQVGLQAWDDNVRGAVASEFRLHLVRDFRLPKKRFDVILQRNGGMPSPLLGPFLSASRARH
jgi:hypothetical protein